MSDQEDFYLAFENQFRGSREAILRRLAVYEDCIGAFIDLHPYPLALDLGCGRGEWLEVLKSWGVPATGVDTNRRMVEECLAKGCDARVSDALVYLKSCSDSTFHIISAFHVVEHMEFDSLRSLLDEITRVLVPGGLLIIETPNPENLVVSCNTFYLDPTHCRPIPPSLLHFLIDLHGFSSIAVYRLNSEINNDDQYQPSLREVILNVSPDYAIVALMPTNTELPSNLRKAIGMSFGSDMHQAVDRYDRMHRKQIDDLERRIHEAERPMRAIRFVSRVLRLQSARRMARNLGIFLRRHDA